MTPEPNESSKTSAPLEVPNLLPILPLRDAVAFPFGVLPLAVGQERSVKLVDDVMRTHRIVGLVTQKNSEAERPAGPDDVYRVGCAAVIHQLLRTDAGSIRLVAQGLERIRLTEFVQTEPYLIARVERAPDQKASNAEEEALVRTVKSLMERLLELDARVPSELTGALGSLADPVQLAYLSASAVSLPISAKQEILEVNSAMGKLRRLAELLQHELAIRELEQKITKETHEEISKSQRNYMLREQLKTIQRELGEENSEQSELLELKEKVEKTPLSEEARKEANRELQRVQSMQPGSPEYGMIRTYLDWLLSLPWAKRTGGPVDVAKAHQVLDEDHYDLEKIKDRILDYLAVRKLREERQGKETSSARSDADGSSPSTIDPEARREPILCFVGPPGVGKTSLGQSIAKAMDRKFVRISLGGVHDESEIRGHRRTYIGALPGRILQALRRADALDPVFMLDEVDKLSASFQGDPAAALLEVLDPAQNFGFVDTYLGIPFDLSSVLFICTANTLETIPPPLLDRLEVLTLSGYTEDEKLQIARRYLLPKQVLANSLVPSELVLADAAMRRIIRDYTREAGVRSLERQLATVARKAARRISEGGGAPVEVKPEAIPELLGRQKYFNELVDRIDRPGVATGLAWTPAGGEILFVEAALVPGRGGGLVMTGMLGEVMKESAQAALSLVRSSASALGIDSDRFEGKSVHIHVPAGAIPKDGPSAGLAILTALASLAKDVPVRDDVAMTGEITLRGKVLPVGGIKEKVLAAFRAGVKRVILPERNRDALDEVPLEVRQGMQFVFVDSADRALEVSLRPERAAAQRPEALAS